MNQITKKEFGGNFVLSLPSAEGGVTEFARCSYLYFQNVLLPGEILKVNELQSYTVFLPKVFEAGSATIVETGDVLNPGDSVQIENKEISIRADNENVRLLVSGVATSMSEASSLDVTRDEEHYKVSKPWGHELWINGEHPGYALKEVFIKAGNRTSLQYHNFKEETNILFKGKARLIYQSGDSHSDLGETELVPISSIHVIPKSLHRLEAAEDTLLYETSTPHLNDVIRISDDSKRTDGRIAAEHRST